MLHFSKASAKPSVASLVLLGALLTMLLVSVPPTMAASGSYSENFLTTTYRDAGATNATGWGSGQLRLPRRTLAFAGGCNTPGIARTVWSEGDYAYVGDQRGLHIVNVTDSAHPTITSSLLLLGQSADLWLAGDYAYVVAQEGVLHAVNVTGSVPTETSSTSTHDYAYGVCVVGHQAFVAIGLTGLGIINVRDPRQLQWTSECNTPGFAYGVWAGGNTAYLADGSSGLQIINVTALSMPVIMGACDTPGTAMDLWVKGRCAYLADYDYGLQVINVTDLRHPTLIGTCDTPGYAISVVVDGDYAYVADDTQGLHLVNVTDPIHPTIVASYDTTDSAQEVFVEGEYAYVATGDFVDVYGGLQAVKIADFTSAALTGTCDTPGYAIGVAVAGDYAYVADALAGLQVIDIKDPRHPSRVGSYNTPGYAMGVDVVGRCAYVADGSSGLQTINITDPRHPTLLSSCNTPDTAFGVRVAGFFAYVAAGSAGLTEINLFDSRHPINVTTTDTPGTAYGVFAVDRRLAYVADLDYGLQIINVTWGQRVILGSCDTPGNALGVWVAGNIAYVADGYSGLQVINVTDPRHPTFLVSCDTPGNAAGVFVAGNLAYVADWTAGLQVINVTDPRHPTLIGTCSMGSYAGGVVVDGDYAYVGNDVQGLQVVEVLRNRCRPVFESRAVAQSLTVNPAPGAASLVRATLTCTQSLPTGTAIAYYLSPDAGAHWENVTPAVEHVFTNVGTQLRWRAVLTTSDSVQTPVLTGLTIAYATWLDAPSLVAPTDGTSTSDSTPTLEWTVVTGAAGYLVQLDTASTFNSPNLRNVNVAGGSTTSYEPATPLLDGTWHWRVAANDTAGDIGFFSTARHIHLDATSPTWDQLPTSQVVEFPGGFRYDVNASDASGIDHYWLNDTIHFSIDGNGVITDVTALPVAFYGLEVRAYDSYTNYCSATLTVTVQDTIPPTWSQLPTDQVAEFPNGFRYDVNASDPSGIDHYWINDTARFAVSATGLITNATGLPVGLYWVEVRAYDPYTHYCTVTFKLTVQDTNPPTWLVMPVDQVLAYGQALDYQLSAWDPSGIDHWTVNDTVHFAINGSGRLTSITSMATGRYGLTVTVYDPYNNARSIAFAVTVKAETTTTTNQPPPIPGFPIDAIALGLMGALGWLVAARRIRRKS